MEEKPGSGVIQRQFAISYQNDYLSHFIIMAPVV